MEYSEALIRDYYFNNLLNKLITAKVQHKPSGTNKRIDSDMGRNCSLIYSPLNKVGNEKSPQSSLNSPLFPFQWKLVEAPNLFLACASLPREALRSRLELLCV